MIVYEQVALVVLEAVVALEGPREEEDLEVEQVAPVVVQVVEALEGVREDQEDLEVDQGAQVEEALEEVQVEEVLEGGVNCVIEGMECDRNGGGLTRAPVPAPRSPAEQAAPGAQQQLQVFQVLGHFAGRALRDGRLLDLEFSEAFWKAALGRHVGLADLHAIDGGLAQSLSALLASEVDASGTRALNGVPVADLALDFTLPGRPGYELCAGGADTPVDGANVEAYVRAVLHATFVEGVRAQMQAFRQGVNKIFPLEHLEVFTESEISQLLCGQRTVEPWTVDYLKKHVTLDHGYDSASAPVQYLFEVLSEFDKDERRQFLQFITGAPTLPYGGLAALRPKLTVVCKYPSGASPGSGAAPGQDLNADLPSVMTCANYFKLPPFTSKATMAERIKVAMTEGAGSFALS